MSVETATFVCLKYFPILLDIIELHGCLMTFAVASFISSFILFFVLKETKCKSIETVDSREKKTTEHV